MGRGIEGAGGRRRRPVERRRVRWVVGDGGRQGQARWARRGGIEAAGQRRRERRGEGKGIEGEGEKGIEGRGGKIWMGAQY